MGERASCEALVCEHYEAVWRFLAYLSGDGAVAEDLTQEVFAAVWAKVGSFKGRGSIAGWIHRIAYNRFIDWKRATKREGLMAERCKEAGGQSRDEHGPFSQLMANEESRLLCEAMDRLESTEHLVVLLHYVQGLSFREMAKVLGEPVGTVKWRTSKALGRLRELLIGRVQR